MSRFEWLMEEWGLLTVSLTRSEQWWRRWLGIVIGFAAVVLMLIVMGIDSVFGKKPQ